MSTHIAIVGTGISGLYAAHHLHRHGVRVTLYEARMRPGGHVNTVDVTVAGERVAVDTGFIVYNTRNYPLFTSLLAELQVRTIPTTMSFSVHHAASSLFWAGRGLGGVFADHARLRDPGHYRMLYDIGRFNRLGAAALAAGVDPQVTIGDWVAAHGFSTAFVDRYLWPMCAAIWSSPARAIADFPLRFFLQFFRNHGMISGRDKPAWRTVLGGARTYVQRLLAPMAADLRLATPVRALRPVAGAVEVCTDHDRHRFDRVILAVPARTAASLLDTGAVHQRRILSAIGSHENRAILHTDPGMMPPTRRAWACWNYHLDADPAAPAAVTYHMNQLQRLRLGADCFLTLGAPRAIASDRILRTMVYRHPAFTPAAIAAQGQRTAISGVDGIHYAGAWWGYGFHEDGARSARLVLDELGVP